MEKEWVEQGLDSVSLATYQFLLSYPDQKNPNKVHLYDSDDNQVTSHMLGVCHPAQGKTKL
jgi:hypothetical protein